VRANLTQAKLAAEAGITTTHVSHLERGVRLSCKIEVAEKMASALGVPAAAIYAAD
jgi:DNA-binding XRE family transcriptional regulator